MSVTSTKHGCGVCVIDERVGLRVLRRAVNDVQQLMEERDAPHAPAACQTAWPLGVRAVKSIFRPSASRPSGASIAA